MVYAGVESIVAFLVTLVVHLSILRSLSWALAQRYQDYHSGYQNELRDSV